MAFGDVKRTASALGASTAATNVLTVTSIAVSVGDLVYALFVEETALAVTGVTDNLGNTYTALNAGTDAGAVTARAFYSRITVAGALTSITFAAAASANPHGRLAVVFEGQFTAIDKNPANITSDITSPYSCPATGVLAQADEMVVAWGAANYDFPWTATSPMILQLEEAGDLAKGVIASKVVTATPTTTPAFTAASNPTQAILATSTFKKTPAPEIITVTNAAVVFTGKTVTLLAPAIPVLPAAVTLTGKTVTVRETDLVPVAKATVTVTGKTVTPVNTSASLSVVVVDKADVIVAGQLVTLTDNLIVSQATITITGKAVGIAGTIPITKASVTFTGGTVTVDTSTFQDIPKYIIRGRGSRYGLWTQGNGGTIKGRGSRAFLVMQ